MRPLKLVLVGEMQSKSCLIFEKFYVTEILDANVYVVLSSSVYLYMLSIKKGRKRKYLYGTHYGLYSTKY